MSGNVVRRVAVNLNGISVAYVMGFFNAVFGVLVTFGVHLTDSEIASMTGLLNAALIMAVHFGHRIGESVASGSSTALSVQASDAATANAERHLNGETTTVQS